MHPDPRHHPLHQYAAIFVVVLAIAAVLAWAIPIPLGLYLAGMVLAALLVPAAASFSSGPLSSLIAAACVTDAIALGWLWPACWPPPAPAHGVQLSSWLAAYVLLLSIALLQCSLLPPLRRIRLASAASVVSLLTLLWFAAPIWLLPHLQSPELLPWMQRLINIHPVFALNASIPFPIWTELPIAYTLVNLNQDVPYTLPSSALPAVVAHLVPAIVLCLIWIKARGRGPR